MACAKARLPLHLSSSADTYLKVLLDHVQIREVSPIPGPRPQSPFSVVVPLFLTLSFSVYASSAAIYFRPMLFFVLNHTSSTNPDIQIPLCTLPFSSYLVRINGNYTPSSHARIIIIIMIPLDDAFLLDFWLYFRKYSHSSSFGL